MITLGSLAATYSAAASYTTTTGSGSKATPASASGQAASSASLATEVAAKVEQALAPAAAGAKQLTTQLTQGQTRLSALGQVHSAIADFQNAAKGLGNQDAQARVQGFVSAFNALHAKLQTLQQGDLKADPAMAQVGSQMTQMLRDAGAGAATGALGKAGIVLDAKGALTLDAARLKSALDANPAAVSKLVTGDGKGVLDKVAGRLATLASPGGAIGRATSATTREVSAMEAKKATITKTLTAQATILASMYTQQAQAQDGKPTSLFDMLA